MFTANIYTLNQLTIKIQYYNSGYPPEHSPSVIFWHRPTTSLWFMPGFKFHQYQRKCSLPRLWCPYIFLSLFAVHPDLAENLDIKVAFITHYALKLFFDDFHFCFSVLKYIRLKGTNNKQ